MSDQLEVLERAGTEVSDAGLAHLKGCKNLTPLNVSQSIIPKLKPR
jgi:hypothetical protein